MSGKLKVTMGMQMVKYVCDLSDTGTLKSTKHYFFCKKHFNKQHQPNIWFKEQQFLVLKGVKRKINIVNGSLAE